MFRSINSFQISSSVRQRINSYFNISLLVNPGENMPTSACYYIDFGNRAPPATVTDPALLNQPKCLLWGPSEPECNELFPEARIDCDRTVKTFTPDGTFITQQTYFYIEKYRARGFARNRVSAKESGIYLIASKDICYYPIVDLLSPQTCKPGINCDQKYPGVKNFYRSQDALIFGNITYNCKSTDLALCEWNIRYLNETTDQWDDISEKLKLQMNESMYNSKFKDINLHQIVLPKLNFQYGLYEICVNCSMLEEIGILYFTILL